MAAVESRIVKDPWVLVQMVRWAVRRPVTRGCVRLYVALMNGLRRELPLHDDVGLLEPLLKVAPLELDVSCHVALDARVLSLGRTARRGT